MASGMLLWMAAILAATPGDGGAQPLSTDPDQETGVASAIAKAPNAAAAATAYQAARTLDRSNPAIPRAYVQRLLEMGQPQLAARAADDLVALDPKDALAHGVIGYLAASKGNIPKALPALVKAARSNPENEGVAYDMGILAIWLIYAVDNPVGAADQQEFMEVLKLVQNKRGFYDGQTYCKDAFAKCRAAADEQRQRLPQLKAALVAAMAANPGLELQLRTLNDRAVAADKSYRQMQIDKARFLADSKSPNSAANAAACEAGMRHAVSEAQRAKQERGPIERALAQRNARILQCKRDVERAEKTIAQGDKAMPLLTFRPPAVKGMVVPEIALPGAEEAPPVPAPLIQAIETAPTFTAAAEAYARARTVNARDAKLYRAYLRRLLQLDQPRMGIMPAQDLVRLDSRDPLACGVLAYASGAEGKIADAAALLVRALKGDADNAGINYDLGLLSVWQIRANDRNLSPDMIAEITEAFAVVRAKSEFIAGAAAARTAFDKRDAAASKAPPVATSAQPVNSQQRAYYEAQYAEAQNGVDRFREDKSARGVAQYRAFELRRQAALIELRRMKESQGGPGGAQAKADPPLPWRPPAVPKAAAPVVQNADPPQPAAPQTPAPKPAPSDNAETQLKMAKMLLANDQKQRAAQILQLIVANHGDSAQAKEAKDLLAKMGF
ncbi:MAG: hypothetical protein ABFD92_09335 [Planctomycetaceae bacterium]|nr:hypothetical protein [Planctomycetaceae bacterium]